MKAQLGKQTGIALALLATLLATLFAMGVFSVVQADTHSATRSFDPDPVAPGGTITVTITLANYPEGGVVNEIYPSGYTLISAGDFTQLGNSRVTYITFAPGVSSSVSYTVRAPMTPGESPTFIGTFASGGNSEAIGGDPTVTVAAATTNGDDGDGEADGTIKLSSQTPSAAVQITIESSASAAVAIRPNQDITVDFKDTGFGLPSTIADSAIDISSDGFTGTPNNVVVSGSKVTLTVPNVRANGDPQTLDVMGDYSVRIKQSAGITNPAAGGNKTIKWQENAPDGAKKEAEVTINRVITLSKKDGTRGTASTATFKGFANGTATINLNGEKLGEVTIADNLGTYEIDTTSAKFLKGDNNAITARDADGNWQTDPDGAAFEITPKVEVDPTETSVSKSVTVKLSDWPEGQITEVELGGESYVFRDADGEPQPYPTIDDTGKREFSLRVDSNANRGTQTVKVTQGEVSATASLTIGVLSLSVQPATVVPGQQITIQGSGFVDGDVIEKVTVGGIEVAVDAEASSAGDVVITIDVPSPTTNNGDDAIGDGTKKVSVSATGSGRVAEGSIEIPEPSITLSPAESRRGTTVNVTGSGFPSGDLVQVKYDNNDAFVTVAAGSADASGAVNINFVVPSYARIGTEHDVEATSVGVYAGVTAEATHETPGAVVTLSSSQIASGETITLSGMNFPAFATVAVMEIGGVDVRPVPAPATSIDGDFESTVLVPGLELGNQTVSARVAQTTITTFLEIVTTAAPSDPADVFASLIDNGSLSRVWFLERETQEWSFYDPAPEFAPFNTLTEVSSGQILDIIMSAQDTFQGETLYVGSNPIAIE